MSFQQEHGILVATPAVYDRPPPSAAWLIESSRRNGIELTLLGHGQPYANDRRKTSLVAEYLRDHPNYRYVLQVDFKDVIFCATLREMFYKYRSIGHDVVAAAERTAWPLASHEHRSPETGTSFRYLNAGTIFSSAETWLRAWDQMQEKERQLGGKAPEQGHNGLDIFSCDQAAWSDLYINGEADIAIDAECRVFQALASIDRNIGTANRDLKFEGRRVVNRETGGRPCLIHGNANVPLAPWAQYILAPPPVWIWPLVDRIRTAPLVTLRDVASVEQLLLELGLHDPIDGYVPDALLPYTGKGLSIWQRPGEFARYLTWLATRPPIRSYVEIGVEAGGSFITTVEFLRRFHPLRLAIGVDPSLSAPVRDYVARTAGVHFVQGTQSSNEVRSLVERAGVIDLILIDGDHSHEGVRADWEYASSRCRYAAFHDIAAENLPGVKSLWEEIRSTYRKTHEFVDQYSQPNPWAGLGVVDLALGTA